MANSIDIDKGGAEGLHFYAPWGFYRRWDHHCWEHSPREAVTTKMQYRNEGDLMKRSDSREFQDEEPCTIAGLVRRASNHISVQKDYIDFLENAGEQSLLECARENLRLMQKAQEIRVLLLSTREQASLVNDWQIVGIGRAQGAGGIDIVEHLWRRPDSNLRNVIHIAEFMFADFTYLVPDGA
jgi:hypothetical protein